MSRRLIRRRMSVTFHEQENRKNITNAKIKENQIEMNEVSANILGG